MLNYLNDCLPPRRNACFTGSDINQEPLSQQSVSWATGLGSQNADPICCTQPRPAQPIRVKSQSTKPQSGSSKPSPGHRHISPLYGGGSAVPGSYHHHQASSLYHNPTVGASLAPPAQGRVMIGHQTNQPLHGVYGGNPASSRCHQTAMMAATRQQVMPTKKFNRTASAL